MDIPSGVLEGGLGVMLIWLGVKYVLPVIRSSVDAAAARSSMDATLHNLYKEQLEQIKALADELMRARTEIANLTSKLSESERRISRLLARINELEEHDAKDD